MELVPWAQHQRRNSGVGRDARAETCVPPDRKMDGRPLQHCARDVLYCSSCRLWRAIYLFIMSKKQACAILADMPSQPRSVLIRSTNNYAPLAHIIMCWLDEDCGT